MAKFIKLQTLFLVVLMLAFGTIPVQAQEEERRFENVETSRVRPLSQSTARALEPVRAALAPEPEVEGGPVPEPNPQVALSEIRDINIDRLPSHEKAEFYNLYGYIYLFLEDNQQAKSYFRQVIDEPEANAPLVMSTIKMLAQLHATDEEYPIALELYLEWMSYQEIIGASDYAWVGSIYYFLEDHDNALNYTERAIGMLEEIGEPGQQNWYEIQRSIYYLRGDYAQVIEILKKVIVYYPNQRHWRDMAGMYLELELTEEQMAAFDIAWLQGGLISENQVIGLASMHMTRGAPLQGAEIIVKGMEDGLVEDTDRNLQTIGQAYYQARELDQALVWMERAAAKSEGGDSYGRLAGVLISLGRFEEAYEAAMEALERGDLDQLTPDEVRLQAGAALFELYRYDEALRVFRAVRDERSRDTATQWIRYVESEASRERQLRASGIDIDAIRAQTRG